MFGGLYIHYVVKNYFVKILNVLRDLRQLSPVFFPTYEKKNDGNVHLKKNLS